MLKNPKKPKNCAMLTWPLFSSSGNFLRMRVIYTAYRAAEERDKMSPRTGFELITLLPASVSPKLTMIVPPMQSNTPMSFNQVNSSPKNAKDSIKVKRLDEVLKIVLDCKS